MKYVLLFEEPLSACQLALLEGTPCRSGGICRNDVEGYKCICTEGWTGDHCEIITKSSVTSSSKTWQKYLSVASSLSCVLGYVSATLLATVMMRMPFNWFQLCITAGFATNDVPEPNFAYLYLDFNNYYYCDQTARAECFRHLPFL